MKNLFVFLISIIISIFFCEFLLRHFIIDETLKLRVEANQKQFKDFQKLTWKGPSCKRAQSSTWTASTSCAKASSWTPRCTPAAPNKKISPAGRGAQLFQNSMQIIIFRINHPTRPGEWTSGKTSGRAVGSLTGPGAQTSLIGSPSEAIMGDFPRKFQWLAQ